MALNNRKVNGVRISPSDHVRLKVTANPPSSDRSVPSSVRTSPRSPRHPVTETLQVDVHLANERFNSLSPGRRCLSDSKINSMQRLSDCAPSAARKRKIDFEQGDPARLSHSKFYRKSGKSDNNDTSHVITDDQFDETLDANQNNVKHGRKHPKTAPAASGDDNSSMEVSMQYKSQHRIGRRRAASSFFSYSETTLSSPWSFGSTGKKGRTKRKKRKSSDNSPLGGDTDHHRSSVSESFHSELSSETGSEQDSVFVENGLSTQNGLVSPSTGKQKRQNAASSDQLTRKPGRPRKSDKGKEDEVTKQWQIKAPPVPSSGLRTRRLASLDAETKVHLMFEKEILQAAEGKKPKRSRKQPPAPHGKPTDFTEIESQDRVEEFIEQLEKDQSVGDHFIDHCRKDVDLMEDPIPNIPVIAQECNIAGKVTCLNCGSETPAIYVHPPPPLPSGNGCEAHHHVNSMTSVPLPTPSRFSLMPASCTLQVLPDVRELFNDPEALMMRLSQLALRHRAAVDSSQCDYLKVLFRHRLARLSQHAISEPEMERVSSTLAHQLSSLINSNYNRPISPTQSSTSTITRQKLVRKVIRPPGLKPAKERLGRKKSTNGWRGVGDPIVKPIVYLNEFERELRYCYKSIKRKEDVISVRDCVLLRSGSRKKDIPFVAKVSAIFEDTETGEIMISLLWYYRPEHTETGRQPGHLEQEIFGCRHWDINNVACIEDKCHVLPMSEYCRYQSELRRDMEGISPGIPVVPELPPEIRHREKPDFSDTSPENVFLCRQVYDYKQRRLLKNPTCKLT